MHPVSPPLPVLDNAAASQVVLRDGSVASLRPATAADVEALRQFFRDLSPESRRRWFCASGDAPQAVIEQLSRSSDPASSFTLIAERVLGPEQGSHVRIIAVGSYVRVTGDSAETAFAVAVTHLKSS